jgi:hypothetical protein
MSTILVWQYGITPASPLTVFLFSGGEQAFVRKQGERMYQGKLLRAGKDRMPGAIPLFVPRFFSVCCGLTKIQMKETLKTKCCTARGKTCRIECF